MRVVIRRHQRVVAALLIVLLSGVLGARVMAQTAAKVTMIDFEFQPKTLTVQVGTEVTWTNSGKKKHSATADDGSFDTGLFDPGQSKSVKFDKPGKFQYYCQLHGGPNGDAMSGVIEVTGGAAQATTAPAEPTAAPAVATAAPTNANNAAAVTGNLAAFSNKAAVADQITVTLKGFTPLAQGHAFQAWLIDSQGKALNLGQLKVGTDGTASLAVSDGKGANLIGQFGRIFVTDQPPNEQKTPGPIVFNGLVPPKSLVHVRHVLFKFPETPNGVGLLPGASGNIKVLFDHIGFAQKGVQANDIKAIRLHLEHIYNISAGGAAGKDLNENGKVEVPPDFDGFGVNPYVALAAEHAKLAADTDDANERVKQRAGNVQTSLKSVEDSVKQIMTLAQEGEDASDLAGVKPLIENISKLATVTFKGASPYTTGFSEALQMGSMDLVAGAPTDLQNVKPEPAATQAAAPSEAGGGQAAGGQAQAVQMIDVEFVPKTLTVGVGTTITWTNAGKKKHSATADDGSFDTGLFDPGGSQSVTFDKAGTFAYHCQLHGDNGGVGMAGVITVK